MLFSIILVFRRDPVKNNRRHLKFAPNTIVLLIFSNRGAIFEKILAIFELL